MSSCAAGDAGEWQFVERYLLSMAIALTIAFVILVSLHVVFGELVPKSISLVRAETCRADGFAAISVVPEYVPLGD